MATRVHDPGLSPCHCRRCAARRAAETKRQRRAIVAEERRAEALLLQATENEQLRLALEVRWQTQEGVSVRLADMEDRHLWHAARLLLRLTIETPRFVPRGRRELRARQLEAMRRVLVARGLEPPDGPDAAWRQQRLRTPPAARREQCAAIGCHATLGPGGAHVRGRPFCVRHVGEAVALNARADARTEYVAHVPGRPGPRATRPDTTPGHTAPVPPAAPLRRGGRRELTLPPLSDDEW